MEWINQAIEVSMISFIVVALVWAFFTLSEYFGDSCG